MRILMILAALAAFALPVQGQDEFPALRAYDPASVQTQIERFCAEPNDEEAEKQVARIIAQLEAAQADLEKLGAMYVAPHSGATAGVATPP